MAALRDIARDFAAEIRDGIGWTIVYRTGRSWNALTIWSDIWNGEWETDDLNNAIGILKSDPDAVIVNGYYCGHFGEDMTIDEIAAGIRWHYATGGFTSGPSIAGEDPRYPTEAVISFNPAYRSQNLSYWAEAGRMLGASSEADYEPISSGSGTAVVYDLSGLSFSPQIKVEGDTDEDALIRKLRDLEPEFIDFILEALSRREGGAYVTADSRLY